jgi:XTP/dITP diphosphohydrolase
MELIFATNNQHKVDEIRSALKAQLNIKTLKQAGIDIEIEEPYDTLEENAREKCRVIHELSGANCFGEDTGLEVSALGGAPGVRSARFAGEPANHQANIEKLLSHLKDKSDRDARFRTVICLVFGEKEYFFEGICEGRIIDMPLGSKGFGYDPVFIPTGADKTFAGMEMDEKNRYSHRKKAADQLVLFLQHRMTT